MSETYPRRFVIRDRDHPDRVLVEGCQWTNGGISTLHHHNAPWVVATNGVLRALGISSSGFDFPGNTEQVELLAGLIWGELHWLDKTDEEITADVEAQQAALAAAWKETNDAMTGISFGARRPWGEPVVMFGLDADEEPEVHRVPGPGEGVMFGDFRSNAEITSDEEPEEDSENKPAGRRFAPGSFVFGEPVFEAGELVDVQLTSSPNDNGPIGVVMPDGHIEQDGFVDLSTTFKPITVEIPITEVSPEALNLLMGPANCKHCGKPIEVATRMMRKVWVHNDFNHSEYCSMVAEPDWPVREDPK